MGQLLSLTVKLSDLTLFVSRFETNRREKFIKLLRVFHFLALFNIITII